MEEKPIIISDKESALQNQQIREIFARRFSFSEGIHVAQRASKITSIVINNEMLDFMGELIDLGDKSLLIENVLKKNFRGNVIDTLEGVARELGCNKLEVVALLSKRGFWMGRGVVDGVNGRLEKNIADKV